MSRIHVTIDRVVLNGFESGTQKPLVEALQSELRQILSIQATRAEWARSHRTPVLKLGRVAVASGSAGAAQFGTQIARRIGRGLKP